MVKQVVWEEIQTDLKSADERHYRAKVPNGWLYRIEGDENRGLTYIYDPKHTWKVDKMEY